ncbi:hypothetical protein BH11PAT1_BH11PAT1_4650 [soil metagenome]
MILEAYEVKNTFEKVKGLIGEKKPQNLLLRTRWGIHTIGLKFPIDIVILDKEQIVAVLKEALKPNNIFLWNPKYGIVLELPAGTIKKEKISKGKKIEIK